MRTSYLSAARRYPHAVRQWRRRDSRGYRRSCPPRQLSVRACHAVALAKAGANKSTKHRQSGSGGLRLQLSRPNVSSLTIFAPSATARKSHAPARSKRPHFAGFNLSSGRQIFNGWRRFSSHSLSLSVPWIPLGSMSDHRHEDFFGQPPVARKVESTASGVSCAYLNRAIFLE